MSYAQDDIRNPAMMEPMRQEIAAQVAEFCKAGGRIACFDRFDAITGYKTSEHLDDVDIPMTVPDAVETIEVFAHGEVLVSTIYRTITDEYRVRNHRTSRTSAPLPDINRARSTARRMFNKFMQLGNRRAS